MKYGIARIKKEQLVDLFTEKVCKPNGISVQDQVYFFLMFFGEEDNEDLINHITERYKIEFQ